MDPSGGGGVIEAVVASTLQLERFGGALSEGVYGTDPVSRPRCARDVRETKVLVGCTVQEPG